MTSRPSRTSPCPGTSSPITSRSIAPKPVDLVEDAIRFDQFTEPLQNVISRFRGRKRPGLSSRRTAHPRIVDGEPSKNPRYLQTRSDLLDPRAAYLSRVGMRLYRRIPAVRPSRPRSMPSCPAAGTIRPIGRLASSRWRSTIPSTTRSCPNCSWTSSPA